LIKKQLEEIQQNWILQIYGAALGLTHVWTFMYWNRNGFFLNSQSGINSEPLCFPFFPDCDLFRQSIAMETWNIILYGYLFLGILTVVSFLSKKIVGFAWSLLLAVSLTKFFLHMSNYNFMGNYHYMVYFVTLAFLFIPNKVTTIKHLIVAFYIAAGFLKVNIDWLSGAAMISSPYIGGPLLIASLFYVLFLELIFVFGLLHRNKWVRVAVLLQLIGFHAFSWHIVGFFYPMVMFCLLAIYPLDEWQARKNNKTLPNDLINFFQFKTNKPTLVMLGLFLIMQLVPLLMVKDPSMSGAARLPSLNMFDSKTYCHTLLVAHTSQGTIHFKKPLKNLGTRLKCDPIVYLNVAHQICRENKETKEIDRLSLAIFTRRVTQSQYKKVLDVKNVCELKNPLWAELSGGGDS
jgi:hypothetical protein